MSYAVKYATTNTTNTFSRTHTRAHFITFGWHHIKIIKICFFSANLKFNQKIVHCIVSTASECINSTGSICATERKPRFLHLTKSYNKRPLKVCLKQSTKFFIQIYKISFSIRKKSVIKQINKINVLYMNKKPTSNVFYSVYAYVCMYVWFICVWERWSR